MNNQSPSVLAVIMAGGQGRRLGGVDKALLPLNGMPLVSHVIARLRPQVQELVINANGDASRFAGMGLPVIADVKGTSLDGPFLALQTALALFQSLHDMDHLLITPTDTPFLPEDLVLRLKSANAPAAYIRTSRAQAAISLWSRDGASRAMEALAIYDGMRLKSLIEACGGIAVPHENETAFFNINSPEDLATAEVIAG